MIGDVNFNMNNDNKLVDCCNILGLNNLIKSNTCFKGVPSLIDVILVTNTFCFVSDYVNTDVCISDFHHLIGCAFKAFVPPKTKQRICYRSFKKYDENAFLCDLSNIRFDQCFESVNVNDQFNTFSELFEETLSKHAPIKYRTIRKTPPPFMNNDLRKAIYKKCMLRNKFVKHKSDYNWNLYRNQRNTVTKLRRKSVRDYFVKKAETSNNSKDFWKIILPFISDKNSYTQENIILRERDALVTDCLEICNTFNSFYTSAADNIGFCDDIPENLSDIFLINYICQKYVSHPSILAIERNCSGHCFTFECTNVCEVKKIVKSLNTKKSAGCDFISPKLLKTSIDILCPVITEIINHCISQGVFPCQLKLAEVSSIFKKKDKLDKNNYRPISVLRICSKVFEKIFVNRITSYFQKIFSSLLCGYREGYNCEHLLLKFISVWKNALDNNKYFGAVLMDLSKAFDCLPHCLLIAKLRAYGFTDMACSLVCSYLYNRKQRVKIGSVKSDWLRLRKGLPQGSIMGPVLFNIFIHDMFYIIDSATLLNYADDNTVVSYNSNIDDLIKCLSTASNDAVKWFTENGMQANPSKFQVIISHRSANTCVPVYINDIAVMPQESVKLLGVTFDIHLTFDMHVDNICRKASRALNVLKRFSSVLSTKSKMKIFQSFINSNFTYCPIVWHFCSKKQTRNIEKIQERSLRFVYKDFNSEYNELLQKANRDTMHVMRLKRILTFVYKCVNNIGPSFLHSMFSLKVSNYNLRNTFLLEQPRVHTVLHGLNSIMYHGPKLWNILPKNMKNINSVKKFKYILKKYGNVLCDCSYCKPFNTM
jgi:hypothetical protein